MVNRYDFFSHSVMQENGVGTCLHVCINEALLSGLLTTIVHVCFLYSEYVFQGVRVYVCTCVYVVY